MNDIVVHVHVHQAAGAAMRSFSADVSGAPPAALEWSPTLCDGKRVNYAVAEKAVAALGPEWRIPTRREWEAILDHERHNPMFDPEQHPDVALGYHWTSTPCPWPPESAVFVVDTSYGLVSSTTATTTPSCARCAPCPVSSWPFDPLIHQPRN